MNNFCGKRDLINFLKQKAVFSMRFFEKRDNPRMRKECSKYIVNTYTNLYKEIHKIKNAEWFQDEMNLNLFK